MINQIYSNNDCCGFVSILLLRELRFKDAKIIFYLFTTILYRLFSSISLRVIFGRVSGRTEKDSKIQIIHV